jgi:hypothetical protein
MNTTNLITDYIISGLIGLLCLLFPFLMFDIKLLKLLLTFDIKNQTVIAILITVGCYSFGVVFNQFADYFEDKIYGLFRVNVVSKSEGDLNLELGFDHHYALQLIVCKSETAYKYISFRRTMIRILRALLAMSILLPLLHLLYSFVFYLKGNSIEFSKFNLLICSISIIFSYFVVKGLIKLYKGYYASLINFCKVINSK